MPRANRGLLGLEGRGSLRLCPFRLPHLFLDAAPTRSGQSAAGPYVGAMDAAHRSDLAPPFNRRQRRIDEDYIPPPPPPPPAWVQRLG